MQRSFEGLLKKGGFSSTGLSLEKLKGDASNRSYYRLNVPGETSLIVMELADNLGIKQAEEKFSGNKSNITELPFINVLRFLEKNSVPVPKLYCFDEEEGLLLLEDVGVETLEDRICGLSSEGTTTLYKELIDHMLNMQNAKADEGCIAFTRTYNSELLEWEFEHYLEYAIEYYHDLKIEKKDRNRIEQIFKKLSAEIASQPFRFTHRDYHSRNIMLSNDKVGIIDFQDALLGPVTYDLASLLRDSYTNLSDKMVDELLGYYSENCKIMTKAEIERYFDITGMQRNLKAAGRFAYIKAEKNNDYLCASIPNTLKKVKKVLSKYDDLSVLHKLLAGYETELA